MTVASLVAALTASAAAKSSLALKGLTTSCKGTAGLTISNIGGKGTATVNSVTLSGRGTDGVCTVEKASAQSSAVSRDHVDNWW